MWVVACKKGARVGVGVCLGKSGTQSGALLPLSLAVVACPCSVSAPALMLPVLVVFVSDNIHYVKNKASICRF